MSAGASGTDRRHQRGHRRRAATSGSERAHATFRVAFWFSVFLIIYGSLYPFSFTAAPVDGGGWADFLGRGLTRTSLGDLLGNIALFVPYGFFALAPRPRARWATFWLLAIVGVALAFALQAAQIYMPQRDAALVDVAWNVLGIGLGAIASAVVTAWGGLDPQRAARLFSAPMLLVALWLLGELLPLVPSLDLQAFKNSVKPLLRAPSVSIDDLLMAAASAFVIGQLLSETHARRTTVALLIALLAMVLVGKIVVVSLALDLSVLLGWLAGLIAWLTLAGRFEATRATVAFFALLAAHTLSALSPFTFTIDFNSFNWVPFSGLLTGSMLSNVQSLAERLFVYGALLWLIRSQGTSLAMAAPAIAVWITLLEVMQLAVEGRTASISEPIWVVMMAFLLSRMQTQHTAFDVPAPALASAPIASAGESRPRRDAAPETVLEGDEDLEILPRGRARIGRRGALVTIALVALAIAVALYALVRTPGIPYNVRELFVGDANLLACWVFALALLWCGVGSAWLGQQLFDRRFPLIALPALTVFVAVVSLLLLMLSVTKESISDIAGSTNLNWFVKNKDIWGAWARELFIAIDSPALVAFFERPVRYAALYGPLAIFLAVAYAAMRAWERGRPIGSLLLRLTVCALPTLLLCKAIAFDWSSTDNLNELIARDGEFGLGGGGYLYLLLALVTFNAVLIACTRGRVRRIVVALMVTAIAVPIGWWLLDHGLESQVRKYGKVFSGAQFLLGPDRSQTMSAQELFARWTVVQLGATLVLAIGTWLSAPLFARRDR